jgi:hypothetical protein
MKFVAAILLCLTLSAANADWLPQDPCDPNYMGPQLCPGMGGGGSVPPGYYPDTWPYGMTIIQLGSISCAPATCNNGNLQLVLDVGAADLLRNKLNCYDSNGLYTGESACAATPFIVYQVTVDSIENGQVRESWRVSVYVQYKGPTGMNYYKGVVRK